MVDITGSTGMDGYIPGGRRQGATPWTFLDQFKREIQSTGPNITGSKIPDFGSRVTQSGIKGGGGRAVLNTATNATLIPSIGQWTTDMASKVSNNPNVQAFGQAVQETVGTSAKNLPKGAKGVLTGAQGLGGGLLRGIAPNAYAEAVKRGAAAKSLVLADAIKKGGLKGGLQARQLARVAQAKPAIKIAGRWAGRRVPLIGAGLDLAAGDPLAATGSLAGGAIGGILTGGNPVGFAVGSMLGGPILKGGRQILSPIFGDPNDPLSGRDWSIGGMPITPYAKTKNQMEKQAKLYSEIQMPLMEQINNAQFEREMRMARLGMMQNMMSSTNSLMSQAYATSSY